MSAREGAVGDWTLEEGLEEGGAEEEGEGEDVVGGGGSEAGVERHYGVGDGLKGMVRWGGGRLRGGGAVSVEVYEVRRRAVTWLFGRQEGMT